MLFNGHLTSWPGKAGGRRFYEHDRMSISGVAQHPLRNRRLNGPTGTGPHGGPHHPSEETPARSPRPKCSFAIRCHHESGKFTSLVTAFHSSIDADIAAILSRIALSTSRPSSSRSGGSSSLVTISTASA